MANQERMKTVPLNFEGWEAIHKYVHTPGLPLAKLVGDAIGRPLGIELEVLAEWPRHHVHFSS